MQVFLVPNKRRRKKHLFLLFIFFQLDISLEVWNCWEIELLYNISVHWAEFRCLVTDSGQADLGELALCSVCRATSLWGTHVWVFWAHICLRLEPRALKSKSGSLEIRVQVLFLGHITSRVANLARVSPRLFKSGLQITSFSKTIPSVLQCCSRCYEDSGSQ